MNRIRIILSVLFISLFSCSFASGQDKKEEQKIKVVIADKKGTKVLIDTAFTGDVLADSIILKEGKVIYIGNNKFDIHDGPGNQIKVIAHVAKDGKNTENQYIYINDGKVISHSEGKNFDVIVSDDEFDNDMEKATYVMSKNGITVTIEGDDENLIKELIKEIERKLDLNDDVPN